MDFVTITPEQKQQFDEQGFLIVRNVLDSETISNIIEASDRLIASDIEENRQVRNDGLYDGFRNCVSLDDVFFPLITHASTFSLVTQLLSPHISLLTSHLIYRYPDPEGSPDTVRMPGWHRDHFTSMRDLGHTHIPRHSLKIAYYLTDLSEPNSGATLMAAGSNHLKERIKIPDGQVDPATRVEPLLKAGDCVFFENRTWHAGTANATNRTRKAVMFGYCYNWMRPIDYRQQSPEMIEKLNRMQRFLVGESVDDTKEFQVGGGANPVKDWCEDNGFTYSHA
jgi:ectoine hydroxylase-related dioxygenase (phytanoyl-CoA dioxygenase family)